MRSFRLYVILDVDICSQRSDIMEIARKIISGGSDILQLRAKSWSDRRILKIGQAIKNLAQKNKVLFVLNDRVDLARIIDTDGVHLGQEDLPIKEARKILSKNKVIGSSTHSVEEAHYAERQGADYIGVGPIFPTATKPKSIALTTEIITKIKDQVKIPFVAVGGINLDNLDQVLTSGAQRVAVCRAIIEAQDVFKATREFKKRLSSQENRFLSNSTPDYGKWFL